MNLYDYNIYLKYPRNIFKKPFYTSWLDGDYNFGKTLVILFDFMAYFNAIVLLLIDKVSCNNIYYTTKTVLGPVTKINQPHCFPQGPIFSQYRTGYCPE